MRECVLLFGVTRAEKQLPGNTRYSRKQTGSLNGTFMWCQFLCGNLAENRTSMAVWIFIQHKNWPYGCKPHGVTVNYWILDIFKTFLHCNVKLMLRIFQSKSKHILQYSIIYCCWFSANFSTPVFSPNESETTDVHTTSTMGDYRHYILSQ